MSQASHLTDHLASEIADENIEGRTVTLKLKATNFEVRTRAVTLPQYVSKASDILPVVLKLLRAELPIEIRLMGIRMANLRKIGGPCLSAQPNALQRLLQRGDDGKTRVHAGNADNISPEQHVGDCGEAGPDTTAAVHAGGLVSTAQTTGTCTAPSNTLQAKDVAPATGSKVISSVAQQLQAPAHASCNTPSKSDAADMLPSGDDNSLLARRGISMERVQSFASPTSLLHMSKTNLAADPLSATLASHHQSDDMSTDQATSPAVKRRRLGQQSARSKLWCCQACTYASNAKHLLRCEMCDTPRSGHIHGNQPGYQVARPQHVTPQKPTLLQGLPGQLVPCINAKAACDNATTAPAAATPTIDSAAWHETHAQQTHQQQQFMHGQPREISKACAAADGPSVQQQADAAAVSHGTTGLDHSINKDADHADLQHTAVSGLSVGEELECLSEEEEQLESGNCVRCPECSSIIEAADWQEHQDWHLAMHLQRQESSAVAGTSNDNKEAAPKSASKRGSTSKGASRKGRQNENTLERFFAPKTRTQRHHADNEQGISQVHQAATRGVG